MDERSGAVPGLVLLGVIVVIVIACVDPVREKLQEALGAPVNAPPRAAGSGDDVRGRAVAYLMARKGRREVGVNRGGWLDDWERANMGDVGWPWCGIAVWQAYRTAGHPIDANVRSVPWTDGAARAGSHGLHAVPLRAARPGDLVVLYRSKDHMGMVRARYRGGRLKTIEGNTTETGTGDGPEGIYARSRPERDIALVVRVEID